MQITQILSTRICAGSFFVPVIRISIYLGTFIVLSYLSKNRLKNTARVMFQTINVIFHKNGLNTFLVTCITLQCYTLQVTRPPILQDNLM